MSDGGDSTLDSCTRAELCTLIERLQEDIAEYKEYIGKEHARQNQRINALETENERLTERVAELEATVDPDPTSNDYDAMSRGERVRKLRETLFDEAQDRHNGKAQMSYKDVLLLFDNRPSNGYAYKLMQLAGEQDGFEYTDANGKVIRVNSNAVKDETDFHTVNKESEQEAD